MITTAQLDGGSTSLVLAALEEARSTYEAAGRYDTDRIIEGVADRYEYWESFRREQTIPVMRDYVRDPAGYSEVKRGSPGRSRLNHGTVYTSRLLSQLGRYEEALDLAEEDLARWPDGPAAWLSKACALYGLGRKEKALVCVERALEIRPDYAVAAGFKARALAGMDRYTEALDYARGHPDRGQQQMENHHPERGGIAGSSINSSKLTQ
ncbi:MAG: tetratricopeptide repeat protein [Nitrosopumilus sp.]|nr:tetratricopeptide repeat protein [Nitrosopumilus sp.]MDA7954484.1 tetratricopeptide repeat protein [Nitrosopumilus sp.]MDA7973517.1 tetratricopeptide repeat protein [Nitrosopumilus sp.]MDA7997317.1 tetratricopeptide repeat protein [Nitrosopumilus sp.]